MRISGIDATEWNQTCTDAGSKEWTRGQAAKRAMARLVGGKIVVCRERARDSYKRSVAVCLAAAMARAHWSHLTNRQGRFEKSGLERFYLSHAESRMKIENLQSFN